MLTCPRAFLLTQLSIKPEDLAGDFDPEEHDRRMAAMFSDEYVLHLHHGDDKGKAPSHTVDLLSPPGTTRHRRRTRVRMVGSLVMPLDQHGLV